MNKNVLYFTLFCLLPLIVMIFIIFDYTHNDEIKIVKVTRYEAGEYEVESTQKERNEIIEKKAHSRGTILFVSLVFFGIAYPYSINKLSNKLNIENHTNLYKLFRVFSIVLAVIAWFILIMDGRLFDLCGMPLANHKLF